MKKTLSVLALSLCSSAAMASIISFEGTVTGTGTCSIEVGTPGGPPNGIINLGNYRPSHFESAGKETDPRYFALRIPASCVTGTQNGFATFRANFGVDPANPAYYALQKGTGKSTGLAMVINDHSKRLAPGTESSSYPLTDAGLNEMVFTANLVSTSATVTEGSIDASVSFDVAIR